MQHIGCEEIQLLISRFVDDEVSSVERERVDAHIASCEACACKLLEYMEMAVLFTETPLHPPAPGLRMSVFREIGSLKEEAQRKEKRATSHRHERPWYLPSPKPAQTNYSSNTFAGRLLRASSPFAVAAVALFFLLGALVLAGRWPITQTEPPRVSQVQVPNFPYMPIPTRLAPIDVSYPQGIPSPIVTAASLVSASPPASASSYVRATATLGRDEIINLPNPTPVLEEVDSVTTVITTTAATANNKANWHTLRDPAYGYTISYPPNWWTYVAGDTRYFYPWGPGGTRYAPYWVELSVSPNPQGLTCETGNEAVCGGGCEVIKAANGQAVWLQKQAASDSSHNLYQEDYVFDSAHIYTLRVKEPMSSEQGLGNYRLRWPEAQRIFGIMSGRLALARPQQTTESVNSAYGGVLFINQADLWLANAEGKGAFHITYGADVRQFAASPDMGWVAYVAADNGAKDVWGTHIYLAKISSNGYVPRTPLPSDIEEAHDLAWYSDHELIAIARTSRYGPGIYKLPVHATLDKNAATDSVTLVLGDAELLTALDSSMAGARQLAVSPDRQLITFLAPVGEEQGTDIYAVRPDGSDLMKLISHTDPLSMLNGRQAMASDNQAIKSYVWAGGHLEPSGYKANLIFTCGNFDSPSWTLGGLLYSASGAARGPMFNPFGVGDYLQPDKMQITHIAYSPAGSATGKVAMTGYFKDYKGRADQLVGLWTADLVNGALARLETQPLPDSPNGIADLQWAPDGKSLIYRETINQSVSSVSARYDGKSDFRIVKLDTTTGDKLALYNGVQH